MATPHKCYFYRYITRMLSSPLLVDSVAILSGASWNKTKYHPTGRIGPYRSIPLHTSHERRNSLSLSSFCQNDSRPKRIWRDGGRAADCQPMCCCDFLFSKVSIAYKHVSCKGNWQCGNAAPPRGREGLKRA